MFVRISQAFAVVYDTGGPIDRRVKMPQNSSGCALHTKNIWPDIYISQLARITGIQLST